MTRLSEYNDKIVIFGKKNVDDYPEAFLSNKRVIYAVNGGRW